MKSFLSFYSKGREAKATSGTVRLHRAHRLAWHLPHSQARARPSKPPRQVETIPGTLELEQGLLPVLPSEAVIPTIDASPPPPLCASSPGGHEAFSFT